MSKIDSVVVGTLVLVVAPVATAIVELCIWKDERPRPREIKVFTFSVRVISALFACVDLLAADGWVTVTTQPKYGIPVLAGVSVVILFGHGARMWTRFHQVTFRPYGPHLLYAQAALVALVTYASVSYFAYGGTPNGLFWGGWIILCLFCLVLDGLSEYFHARQDLFVIAGAQALQLSNHIANVM